MLADDTIGLKPWRDRIGETPNWPPNFGGHLQLCNQREDCQKETYAFRWDCRDRVNAENGL